MPAPSRPLAAVLAVAALSLAACGGGDADDADAADEPTTTTEAPTTTTEAVAVPGAEADPTATLLGGKAILLDGFLGVRIPEGWSVTTATPVEASESPPGGETAADPDAIDQVLVIGPEADPMAATFALLHYSHSDSVPDLERFTEGILPILGADGTRFTEGEDARIGGQEARLHQLETPEGANGVVVTMTTGEEYFVVLSIVSDDAYAPQAGDLLASVSVEPSAIG